MALYGGKTYEDAEPDRRRHEVRRLLRPAHPGFGSPAPGGQLQGGPCDEGCGAGPQGGSAPGRHRQGGGGRRVQGGLTI